MRSSSARQTRCDFCGVPNLHLCFGRLSITFSGGSGQGMGPRGNTHCDQEGHYSAVRGFAHALCKSELGDCVSKNDESCIKNEELCIKNEGFILKLMHFAGRRAAPRPGYRKY